MNDEELKKLKIFKPKKKEGMIDRVVMMGVENLHKLDSRSIQFDWKGTLYERDGYELICWNESSDRTFRYGEKLLW